MNQTHLCLIVFVGLWAGIAHSGPRIVPDPTSGERLTLNLALELAMEGHPALAAAAAGIQAARERSDQARRLPNPELELAISDVDRAGHGFDDAETAAILSQRLETGGKRRWRSRRAQTAEALAGWDLAALRLDVKAETTRRFIAVVAAQQRYALALQAARMSALTTEAVLARVEAGKEPPFRAARVNAELALARLRQETAGSELAVAGTALAVMWGSEHYPFETAEDRLSEEASAPPDFESLLAMTASVPERARWEQEILALEAALAEEKAQRIPDIGLFAGVQRFEEDARHAITFGVTLPLGVFDRNQGGIAAAHYDLDRGHAEQRAVEVAIKAELAAAHATAAGAYGRAKTLEGDVLPAMKQAFEAAQEGYLQGKVDFLDMQDAQNGLLETQLALCEALEASHNARTRIDRLTGCTENHEPNIINTQKDK